MPPEQFVVARHRRNITGPPPPPAPKPDQYDPECDLRAKQVAFRRDELQAATSRKQRREAVARAHDEAGLTWSRIAEILGVANHTRAREIANPNSRKKDS